MELKIWEFVVWLNNVIVYCKMWSNFYSDSTKSFIPVFYIANEHIRNFLDLLDINFTIFFYIIELLFQTLFAIDIYNRHSISAY